MTVGDLSARGLALVIDIADDALRGVLLARVEGQARFITSARCERHPSLSATVELLSEQLAIQTGLAVADIQRDPLFVSTNPDDLTNRSLAVSDRLSIIAQSCAAAALIRDEQVGYLESRLADGQVVVVRATPSGRPEIHTRPVSTPRPGDPSAALTAQLEEIRLAWRSTGGGVGLLIAGEPFLTMEPSLVLLTLADSVVPASEQMDIVIDADGLAPVAGLLADEALVSVVQHDLLLPYGRVLTVRGAGESGTLAIRGAVTYAATARARFSLSWGGVRRIAPRSRQGGTITIAGQPGATINGQRIYEVDTTALGKAGLLVDARDPERIPAANPDLHVSWLAEVAEL